ncbi:MAG: CNNM domain-containing protein, partial [Paenisporosarcina sp.]
MEFIALAISLMLSFFFSGSETALTAVNRMKVQHRAEQGERMAQKLLMLIAKPDRMITTILIGNNIVNIAMPTLLTLIALKYDWDIALATAVLTIIIIIFGEVLPKTIAVTFADKIAYIVAPIISVLVQILRPLTFLIAKFTNIFIRIISKGAVKEATLTKEELRSMVDIASTEGTFKEDESERLKGVLDFPHKDVEDVLETHRTEIVGIPTNATYEEVRDIILEHYYTRYPVYEESMDHIVGMFYSKTLIEWSMDPTMDMHDLIDNDPLFVVQSVSVEKVFKQMLTKKKHMAIVLDEYGGTLGIVTHEDIIEEMIGQEIEDESDEDEDILVYEMTEHRLICHGRLEIEDVNEMFKVEIPNDHDTIGGFVLQQLGHMPDNGEQFSYENLHFEVNEMDRNR